MLDLSASVRPAVAPVIECADLADITPMNRQILSFGFGDALPSDGAETDRRIDETLRAMFDDADSLSSPCLGYYCTGYWPMAAADTDSELPN